MVRSTCFRGLLHAVDSILIGVSTSGVSKDEVCEQGLCVMDAIG